jgi:hypothetical protein
VIDAESAVMDVHTNIVIKSRSTGRCC